MLNCENLNCIGKSAADKPERLYGYMISYNSFYWGLSKCWFFQAIPSGINFTCYSFAVHYRLKQISQPVALIFGSCNYISFLYPQISWDNPKYL
jgi:hypothetical protein